jgi:hypothetical protein
VTLTVDEVRGHVETTLEDDALQALIAAAYEAIDMIAGASGSEDYPASVTEVISAGSGDLFMLSRPAESITSITEGISTTTDLGDDDYELLGNQMVRRLSGGTNGSSYWRSRMIVTYTPLAMSAERDRVALALIKLDVTGQPGLVSQRLGEWSETFSTGTNYDADRAAILASFYPAFVAK